ncbi:phage tail tape measure protein [Pararhizobium haloflavum]|uniref:phage tail tape measure protein n=1 Tax=Pararhizobium haloflavum TaxID=2037914 RepID=UPI000C19EA30|nr:phage tail tape measure protein [Pararhizobium haloflavum]
MAGSVTSTLVVRLLDKVSTPAKAAARSLGGIQRAANRTSGTLTSRVQGAIERNNRALDETRGRLVDAVGGFYLLKQGLTAPMTAARDFESQLEDIGQKAEIPTSKLGELGKQITKIGRDTNQASSQIAAAIDNLVGKGASTDVALAAADPIGRAATAYRASTDDLASASWSAVDNLKVPAEQIETAIDMMAQAGKEGAFELRDMAQYFPALGASYQALGQEGTSAVADLAAALQVVRKGTGDSSSAATNLANVLQKIYAPATIKKFGDAGIDIFKEMEAAAQRGLTPIEAIADITDRALDGDLKKLGTLFEDAQVQQGLRSIIQNMEEYRRIRDEAMRASGVVEKDFQNRIQSAEGATLRWQAAVENLSIAIGNGLLPLLSDVTNNIVPLIDKIGALAEAHPRLARAAIVATGGMIALRVGMIGVRWAALMMRGGALAAVLPIIKLGSWAKRAATNAVGLQASLAALSGVRFGPLSKASVALGGIARAIPGVALLGTAGPAIAGAVAAITAPAWGAIAIGVGAVALAGAAIYKYWDRVSSIFKGVGRAISEHLLGSLSEAGDRLSGFKDTVASKVEQIADAFGFDGSAARAAFERMFDFSAIREKLSGFFDWIGGMFSREVLSEDQKAGFEQAGYDIANRLINAVKETINGLVEWFRGLPGKIIGAIGSIDLSKIIKWPTPPSWWTNRPTWMGGTGGASAPANDNVEKRAKGGPVRRGKPYIVGEEGMELFTPDTNGSIMPHRDTMSALRSTAGMAAQSGGAQRAAGGGGALTINAPIHIHGIADPKAVADAVGRELEERQRQGLRAIHADI